MTWKITFSKNFSLECRGTQASISLERKSRLASCVILALGTLVTSVLKKKQNNEIRKERWGDWMKEETKYRMIECTRICININYCFLSYSKAIISKNRFVTHLRTTIIKNWHQWSSHCHISDAWHHASQMWTGSLLLGAFLKLRLTQLSFR